MLGSLHSSQSREGPLISKDTVRASSDPKPATTGATSEGASPKRHDEEKHLNTKECRHDRNRETLLPAIAGAIRSF